jgi:hypothetical protein
VIFLLQTCLKAVIALYHWIDQSSTWLLPGKYTWQLNMQPDKNKEPDMQPQAETAMP